MRSQDQSIQCGQFDTPSIYCSEGEFQQLQEETDPTPVYPRHLFKRVEGATQSRLRDAQKQKAAITFQIESSLKRRNVDKYILKSVVRFHLDLKEEILQEYRANKYTAEEFYACANKLQNLREIDKVESKGPERTKRDYAHSINALMSNHKFLIILKHCLGYCLVRLNDPQLRRIKEANKVTYRATTKDYLDYVNRLLDECS